MDLDDTSIEIATEAWSQLVHSIISDTPPSDMEPEYYFAYLLIEESKRSKSYEYKLGTRNIQAKMGSGMHSQMVRAHEHEMQQGIEHIQDCTRSSKYSQVVCKEQNQEGIEHIQVRMRSTKLYDVVQAKEDNKQGIEHIQYCMRSTKHCEVVQANEHENQQDIEHIHDRTVSAMHYEGVPENEHGNQQRMECIEDNIRLPLLSIPREYDKHQSINNLLETTETRWSDDSDALEEPSYENQQWINRMQARKMSLWFDELLDLIEDGDLQGKEKLILNPKVVCLVKLLHHYGVDTIRSGVVEELENLNQKHVDIEKDLEIQYKRKGLEVMLRICDNELCQKLIYQIIGKEENGQVVYY